MKKTHQFHQTLDGFVIPNRCELASPAASESWDDVFEEIFLAMDETGGGTPPWNKSGDVYLNGFYGLKRTLDVPPFVQLRGSWSVRQNLGNSCGFYPLPGFEGDTLIRFRRTKDNRFYSNFGAGMRDIYVSCYNAEDDQSYNGVDYTGSQQASVVEGVVIDGYGHGKHSDPTFGMKIDGDFYVINRLHLDARITGPGELEGTIGLLGNQRLVGVTIRCLTVHNSAVGFQFGDIHNVVVDQYDTEITGVPVRQTYNSVASKFMNCRFLGNKFIADIERDRWKSSLHLSGFSAADSIRVPSGGLRPVTFGSEFDFNIRTYV